MIQNPEDPLFELYPLSIKIPFEQKLLILESDPLVRKNLLMVLTNNLIEPQQNTRKNNDVIKIGGFLMKNMQKNSKYVFMKV